MLCSSFFFYKDTSTTKFYTLSLHDALPIYSCSVRDWVNWLSKLESNGTRSVLVECSPAIVAQINLVNNFTGDRKSTRLNSSHVEISYAVFCLKKKNKQYTVLDTA